MNRYVPSSVDPTRTDQRIVEAAGAAPNDGAVAGWASLHWRGARWFGGLASDGMTRRPVPLWVGHDRAIRPISGAVLTEEFLKGDDLEFLDGLRVTTALRSVFHEVRQAPTARMAGGILEMALADDLISIEEMWHYAERRLSGIAGVVRLRDLLEHADENCWSPTEYSMRQVWTVDGNFPRPLCNVPIFSRDGVHLFTPDLFDPAAGVAGEYDGSAHLELAQRVTDIDREELYRSHGIEWVTMLSPDLRDRSAFLRRLRSAYGRANERMSTPPTWTLDQPPWWVDTSTVARRRELDEHDRRIWLRHRAS